MLCTFYHKKGRNHDGGCNDCFLVRLDYLSVLYCVRDTLYMMHYLRVLRSIHFSQGWQAKLLFESCSVGRSPPACVFGRFRRRTKQKLTLASSRSHVHFLFLATNFHVSFCSCLRASISFSTEIGNSIGRTEYYTRNRVSVSCASVCYALRSVLLTVRLLLRPRLVP